MKLQCNAVCRWGGAAANATSVCTINYTSVGCSFLPFRNGGTTVESALSDSSWNASYFVFFSLWAAVKQGYIFLDPNHREISEIISEILFGDKPSFTFLFCWLYCRSIGYWCVVCWDCNLALYSLLSTTGELLLVLCHLGNFCWGLVIVQRSS